MVNTILSRLKEKLTGDKSVKLVAEDLSLTAELLLLFRVMLADGQVVDAEVSAFKRICSQAFGLDGENLEGVYQYLEDYAYEMTSAQATELFQSQPLERRQQLLEHMIAIAEADAQLHDGELKVIDRTAAMLGFDLKAD
ncbi:MAG: TerB family tellurite resistance protein [Ahrensia sp.]